MKKTSQPTWFNLLKLKFLYTKMSLKQKHSREIILKSNMNFLLLLICSQLITNKTCLFSYYFNYNKKNKKKNLKALNFSYLLLLFKLRI